MKVKKNFFKSIKLIIAIFILLFIIITFPYPCGTFHYYYMFINKYINNCNIETIIKDFCNKLNIYCDGRIEDRYYFNNSISVMAQNKNGKTFFV